MGSGVSRLFSCFRAKSQAEQNNNQEDVVFAASEPLDETLGHSFCYVRSSARFLSPTHSDRFISPSTSLRFSPSHTHSNDAASAAAAASSRTTRPAVPETAFRAISGASVSANSSTPRTVLQLDNIYDDATDAVLATGAAGGGVRASIVNGFESTSSFCALPLQTVPRGCGGGGGNDSMLMERGGFFLSGPIERGALSGPLDAGGLNSEGGGGGVPFSAPLGGMYVKRKKKKGISGIRKAFYRNFSEKKRPWVVPVLNFVGRKEGGSVNGNGDDSEARTNTDNVQWALGKAGEDRVHVVVSEEQGWLFVGIYDGFNGPDAPEFLMGNLYRAVYNQLQGLFWEIDQEQQPTNNINTSTVNNNDNNDDADNSYNNDEKPVNVALALESQSNPSLEHNSGGEVSISIAGNSELDSIPGDGDRGTVAGTKRVTFQSEEGIEVRRRRLWEFLAEDDAEDGLDLSGSDRFAFSVDDALRVSNAGSAVSRRWLLLSKLKQGLSKHKEGHGRKLFPWSFGLEEKEKVEVESRVEERSTRSGRKRKEGPVDHKLVLRALSQALELTELAYLDLTDKVLDTNPELALMGSCLLVVLMRDEDVYVMNVGDSRAIVAQYEPQEVGSSMMGPSMEGITEETSAVGEKAIKTANEAPAQAMKLMALQLSTDHSTSIEQEVIRIKNEHPDDKQCIVNDRVKGRLKVTRAFGAGFLKQPKWNDSLLEMFRNEYIGTAPYISCSPSLRHHRLCPRDQFLVLSSDGLYQYLSNQEVVSHVESFMEKFPEGDPAQHLIEELLYRAAKKAGK
uniref:PPM-type phosphatase domain-containing protein n=1 Tax=Fagus sylvatica TaxID=28930 RepID=A0A2N9HES9_FAGSY